MELLGWKMLVSVAFLSFLTWCQRLYENIVYIIEWVIGYNHATVVTGRI